MKSRIIKAIFPYLDNLFRKIDRNHILRTRNIGLIPGVENRRGGKLSYAEWDHVIGIFQTLICQELQGKTGNAILDIGCGTGLMGIAAEPFTSEGGSYTGIDVMKQDIDFCVGQFSKNENYRFIHFDVSNPTYAAFQTEIRKPWPLEDESYDLVTAVSVWTHLNEADAVYYMNEVSRVLKKGCRAIITLFLLDTKYEDSLQKRNGDMGKFHRTSSNDWIFNQQAYMSKNWFSPSWARVPEDAIGVSSEGFELLLKESELSLAEYYPGNWKEIPGVFFQDVLILEK